MVLNKKGGFTLIELMVVISIIALLSTIVMTALHDAKVKGEWSKFSSELIEIRTAVELFKSDNNAYPDAIVTGVRSVAFAALVEELNEEGYYGADAIDLSLLGTGGAYIRNGYLNTAGTYFSCGGDHEDVEYVIYVNTGNGINPLSFNSSIRLAFVNGEAEHADPTSSSVTSGCIEI